MKMRAARMHGYKEPLRLEEIPVPDFGPEEVLVKVGGAGVCRSDFQMIDGYFADSLTLEFPVTPGHEIAGWVDGIGAEVPKSAGLAEGDQVVVESCWGDGVCRQCHDGNEQLCGHGQWAGFGPPGGYQEYVPVHYRHLIRVPAHDDVLPQNLAPLTDAGLTPYRGLKKLRSAGVLGAGRTVAVMGVGGLGVYATQYAKLLGGGATVVAFARNDDKLAVARENGADHTINTRGKTAEEVRTALESGTGRPDVDAVIECAGSEESIRMAFDVLAIEGAVASVGLIGNRINIPLFPFVAKEFSYFGSFWGNYNDLTEVIALAEAGRIRHTVTPVRFDDINDTVDALARGDIVGRAVMVYN
ncbi:NAD(P)-dependent alcohol dehydrogenase [Nocardia sp. NPDC049190]|uniref:NAD(P)-dependent alcohol dehydrogenase n=1 Tax=Nocardia sp. NPDC049190 TaxID=3155650 RepID=UPI0033FA8E28